MPSLLLKRVQSKLIRLLYDRGFFGTLLYTIRFPFQHLWSKRPSVQKFWQQRRDEELEFDRVHNVDTAGEIPLEGLTIVGPNQTHGHLYLSTGAEELRRLLDSLPISFRDYIFVDFGSGKGKVLLLASHYPFKQIIGVEFAEELERIARSNIQSYRSPDQQCRDIVSYCMDASTYEIPAENAVLYFFNPFGEKVISLVLDRVEQSLMVHPRAIIIIYTFLHSHVVLDKCKSFFPVKKDPRYVIYANSQTGLPRLSETS